MPRPGCDRAGQAGVGVAATVDRRRIGERADRLEADGLLSRCLQHEIDHLDGILFFDRVSPLKRKMLLTKWAKGNRGEGPQ